MLFSWLPVLLPGLLPMKSAAVHMSALAPEHAQAHQSAARKMRAGRTVCTSSPHLKLSPAATTGVEDKRCRE